MNPEIPYIFGVWGEKRYKTVKNIQNPTQKTKSVNDGHTQPKTGKTSNTTKKGRKQIQQPNEQFISTALSKCQCHHEIAVDHTKEPLYK